MRSATAVIVSVCLLLASAGCESARPPAYVRLAGEAAPALEGVPTEGVWLVSFWATWCAPCREETPALRKLARKPPSGLRVLLVSEDRTLDEVRHFFGGEVPRELTVRLDEEERWMKAFGAQTLPVSFLVVEGRLVARFDGARAWDARGTRELLGRLVGEASSPSRGPRAP